MCMYVCVCMCVCALVKSHTYEFRHSGLQIGEYTSVIVLPFYIGLVIMLCHFQENLVKPILSGEYPKLASYKYRNPFNRNGTDLSENLRIDNSW